MNLETQIALLAPTLFTILMGLIVLSLIVNLANFKSSPTRIARLMCSFWFIQLLIFIIVPLFDKGNIQQTIPFSLNFVTIYLAYKILFANIAPVSNYKAFTYIFLGSWVIAIINETLFSNFTLTTMPVALAEIIPLGYMLYLIAFSNRQEFKTIYHKWSFIVFFFTAIHVLNFSLFRDNPANYIWGMTGHIFLVYSFSLTLSNFYTYLLSRDEQQRLTELVNLKTKALSSKYLELKAISEEKARLFRIVIHDLSNPITSLINFLSFLKRPEITLEQRQKITVQAHEVTNGMINIINQVRAMEGVKAGKLEFNKDLINLAETFNIVELVFRSQYERKGVLLKIENPSEEILFYGNKDLFIHTVLSNLLSNSLKFSLPGSIVHLSYKIVGDQLQVLVIDQGKGIHRKRLSSIFSMDVPTTTTGTQGEAGTGFGMPLVKSYLDEVEGKINITSKTLEDGDEDHGTKVELLFGLHKNEQSFSNNSLSH